MSTNKRAKSICPVCKAKTVYYSHTLTEALVIGLWALFRAGKMQPNVGINLAHLGLSRNQWDNFQKLRYWGLVGKTYEDGKRVKGVWEVTRLGQAFIEYNIAISPQVQTYRGEAVSFSGEPVMIRDRLSSDYKQREAYARDAQGVA